MRTLVLFLGIFLFGISQFFGQVKIGDNPQTINPAAVLELESTSMVLIITRVTTEQMQAIVPGAGALVYNTDAACIHYYNGTEWVNLCSGGTANVNITTEPIVNQVSTIALTPTANGNNLEVAENSIRTEQIIDGGIFGDDINDNSIGPDKLANNSVGKFKLSENAVGPFAIDRDSLPLSFFINDVPFLTSGDLTTVSTDTDNAISSGADGGAYYNQQPLLAAIANDLDTSPENELQNLSLTGNVLTLSDPINGDDVIDLESFAGGGGNPTDELITNAVITGTDLIITEGGNDTSVSLATIGNQTAAEVSFDPYLTIEATDAQTAVQELKDEIDVLSATGGGSNNLTFEVMNGNLEITDGAGTLGVPLSALGGGSGTPQTASEVPYDNATSLLTATDAQAAIDELAAAGGTDDQIAKEVPYDNTTSLLTATDTQAAIDELAAVGGNGTTELADQVTISGDGQVGTEFQVADAGISTLQLANDAVTTLNILDEAVTPAKIEAGSDGQVLSTNITGDVVWSVGGEANTASNEGVGGQGLLIQKTAENLEFKNLNSGSNKITITEDAVNNEIDIDIDEANLSIPAAQVPYDPSISGFLPATVTDTQSAIDALSANGDSDSQNIEGSVLTGETLTIGIEDGSSQDVNLSPFALDTDVAATIAATELADGDRDDRNEIQNITSTDGTVTITQTDDDFDLSISGSSVSGAQGSVFFADTDGSATENNGQLFWDTSFGANGALGIGNNSPQSKLHVSGEIRSEGFNSSGGTENAPAFSFSTATDSNTGMYRIAADELGFSVGGNLALTIDEPRSGITNVIVNGAFSTNIRSELGSGTVTILENDHTVIIENASTINLPLPANSGLGFNEGKTYILKNLTGADINIGTYINSMGNTTTDLSPGVTQLQSDGSNWHQIN